jgi:hypothetical protein
MSDVLARNRSRLILVATVLVWLAALRCFYVVLHEPMFGYGNQFDMGRTAACVDLWPDRLDGARDEAYWDGPITRHRVTAVRSQACYPSAEVALAWVAINVDRIRSMVDRSEFTVDLRTHGLLKALLLLAMAWILHRGFLARPMVAVVHGAILMLVLADPVHTLFFNTLYAEFISVAGVYGCVGALAVRAATGIWTREAMVIFFLGVTLLAFSRMQHVLLPAVFTVFFLLSVLRTRATGDATRRVSQGLVALTLVAVTGGIAVHLDAAGRIPVLREVNRHDAIFWALLPAAESPERITQRLGLEPICAKLAYASFYRQHGRDINTLCPQAKAVSLLRIAYVAATEPQLLRTMWLRGVLQSSAWRLAYVGEVADAKFERMPQGPMAMGVSVSILATRASFHLLLIFWGVPIAAGVIAFAALLRAPADHREAPQRTRSEVTRITLICFAGVSISVWASALLGDGYSEMARHLHLGIMVSLCAWIVVLSWLASARWRRSLLAVAATAVAAMVVPWQAPISVGELREPLADRNLADDVTPSGWVLAPSALLAVELEHSGRVLQRVAVSPSPIMAAHHPIGSGRLAFDFRFDHGMLTALEGSTQPLELYAVLHDGSRSRIDRRYPCTPLFPC